ncbi:MAG: preprotein translocase subunit SecG [Patescibacteria group bacterium]|jgi:preprotein translocase subunit SecG|nr:preprotein translocase subunit SecG [Patescibacteria group bacterium]
MIKIIQLIISILLIIVILLQSKGTALGGVFGGSNTVFLTKRGIEKKLFILTIILAVLFFAVSLGSILLDK